MVYVDSIVYHCKETTIRFSVATLWPSWLFQIICSSSKISLNRKDPSCLQSSLIDTRIDTKWIKIDKTWNHYEMNCSSSESRKKSVLWQGKNGCVHLAPSTTVFFSLSAAMRSHYIIMPQSPKIESHVTLFARWEESFSTPPSPSVLLIAELARLFFFARKKHD